MNNHFNDFETNSEMMKMLENFEQALEREVRDTRSASTPISHVNVFFLQNKHNHTSLLNIACSVKSKSRTLTYTRSNKEEILHFSVLGGYEKGYGIFVSKVESVSKAEKVGLKRGDEVGISFILPPNSQHSNAFSSLQEKKLIPSAFLVRLHL